MDSLRAQLQSAQAAASTYQPGIGSHALVPERILDTTKLVKAPQNCGKKEDWSDFKFKLINYMVLLDSHYRDEINSALVEVDEIDDEIDDGMRKRSQILYAILVGLFGESSFHYQAIARFSEWL